MKNKALKRLIYGFSTFVIPLALFSFKPIVPVKRDLVTLDSSFKIKTVIVDAGHGNHHPSGAKGYYSMGASGSYSYERDVTLAVAFKLQTAIEKELQGVKAVMTRTTDDDVSWPVRAQIANENKGNIFISLHCNSLPERHVREVVGHKHHKPIYKTYTVPDRSGKGVLLLVYATKRTKEEENAIKQNQIEQEDAAISESIESNDPTQVILINQFKAKFRKQSIILAKMINDEFVQTDGRPSDGIREQSLYLLCHSAMPSVLVEMGYINNPDDEAYMNSEKGQNEIVDTIVRALRNYKDEVEDTGK
ncbi:MAG: N-acetylmuramoyl-L-alanine amidase [Sphingobacteriales bacterium]